MDNTNNQSIDTRKRADLYAAFESVDNILLKKYIKNLVSAPVCILPEEIANIVPGDNICVYHVDKIAYDKDENTLDKLTSVYSSVAAGGTDSVALILTSDGQKTDIYLGIVARELIGGRVPPKARDLAGRRFADVMSGNFPGTKLTPIGRAGNDDEKSPLQKVIDGCFHGDFESANIASVSSIPALRNHEENKSNEFVQGLEKLVDSMRGKKYSAIFISDVISSDKIDQLCAEYEDIYAQLFPFKNSQHTVNTSESKSDTNSIIDGVVNTTNESLSKSLSHGVTQGTSKANTVGVNAGVTIGPENGPHANFGVSASHTSGEFNSTTESTGETNTTGTAKSLTKQNSVANTLTSGSGESLMIAYENRAVKTLLDRIDEQIKRLRCCEDFGMFDTCAYFLADDYDTVVSAAATYRSLVRGENSSVEAAATNIWTETAEKSLIKEYLTRFYHPMFEVNFGGKDHFNVTPALLISGKEMAVQYALPKKSIPGIQVFNCAAFGRNVLRFDCGETGEKLSLGNIFHMQEEENTPVSLDVDSLASHTFITGSTGSGKSNTVYGILGKLHSLGKKFLVIEPAKGEYKNIFGHYSDVSVYGTNPSMNKLLRINPFSFPTGIHIYEHIDRLVEIFNACWPMYAAMPAVLKDAIERAYESAGWDLRLSKNRYNDNLFPNFADVLREIDAVMDESEYSSDSRGDYKGALCTRIRSLTNGINSLVFTSNELSPKELFDRNVIADLSRVGSAETKSLIMGILIMKLQEYRMTSSDGMNQKLSHVTVLEEAHNLLKRTLTEQSSEGSNLIGKSVEMLTNAIAEMRTYGEGFIIADQAPGLLDMAVIRNTNTKIILRLPDFSDRQLVGRAAGLTDDQITELSKLPKGVAAVYQNDWVESVLCKVEKYNGDEITFAPEADELKPAKDIRRGIVTGLSNVLHVIDRVDDTVIKSDISARAKCAMYRYLESPEDYESRMSAAGELIAALFDCDRHFSEVGKITDVEDQRKYLLDHIRPELTGYSDAEIDQILVLLVVAHTNEANVADEKVFANELVKELGGKL